MKYRILTALVLLAPFALFTWCVFRAVAPFGSLTTTLVSGGISPYVQSFLPNDRILPVTVGEKGTYVRVVNDPVYFTVTPPAEGFTSAHVTIAFDPHDTPIVELGALRDVASQSFDFYPLANAIVEHSPWTPLSTSIVGIPGHDEDSGLVVLSKNSVNATREDFLAHPPDRSTVAVSRTDFPTPYRMPDYAPLGRTQTFDVSLRGSHTFLTYVKGEDVRLDVMYTDVNRTPGRDDGSIEIRNESGDIMAAKSLVDDGNTSTDQTFSSQTHVVLAGRGWDEGVYKITLSGTSDIVWRRIATSLRYVAFTNTLYVADDVGYLTDGRATPFVTDVKHVTLETFHADSPSMVTFGKTTVHIPLRHTPVAAAINDTGVVDGSVPVGDVKLVGDGTFAFSRASFFDPNPVILSRYTDVDATGVSYILANVAPVRFMNGWRVASATVPLLGMPEQNGAYTFALSAPGIGTAGDVVDVHSVTVTFTKSPLSFVDTLRAIKHLFF